MKLHERIANDALEDGDRKALANRYLPELCEPRLTINQCLESTDCATALIDQRVQGVTDLTLAWNRTVGKWCCSMTHADNGSCIQWSDTAAHATMAALVELTGGFDVS